MFVKVDEVISLATSPSFYPSSPFCLKWPQEISQWKTDSWMRTVLYDFQATILVAHTTVRVSQFRCVWNYKNRNNGLFVHKDKEQAVTEGTRSRLYQSPTGYWEPIEEVCGRGTKMWRRIIRITKTVQVWPRILGINSTTNTTTTTNNNNNSNNNCYCLDHYHPNVE